ncbi:IS110 family transposase [Sphingobium sp. CR2-8]|uniref:IS110 family transposase n=1 Tax=Sphingobium sp. CR2-8 TaxID=1306534 RepID=UPI002DBB306B|nr:IS110 family transposase [Sphingobium sp. CR2-8]MEC3910305.1 IS110 family transposase [Sphingobium sp. CR2-8]
MQQFWAGLDIGEARTAICVTSNAGEVLLEQMATSDIRNIADVLKPFMQLGGMRVSIEAGMGNQLARKLRELGYSVVVFDTITSNKFLTIRRNKTDTNDARGLADLGRMRRATEVSVHVKSVAIQRLRSQLVFRDQLLRQRTAIDSALRALLRENGADPKAVPPNKGWRVRLEQELTRLMHDEKLDLTPQARPMVDIREALDRYVKAADKYVLQTAESNPVTRRFLQIPGVGPISALSFYSAIDDPIRFATSADVGAYLGLVPRVKQSGTICQHSRITKAGNKMTRGHLVMAAGVLISRTKTECALKDWGRQLAARAGHGKAKVAVARKLATLMLSLWKSGQDFQPFPIRI